MPTITSSKPKSHSAHKTNDVALPITLSDIAIRPRGCGVKRGTGTSANSDVNVDQNALNSGMNTLGKTFGNSNAERANTVGKESESLNSLLLYNKSRNKRRVMKKGYRTRVCLSSSANRLPISVFSSVTIVKSEVEVVYDETTQFMASGGANDASLYKDEDYDIYDTYDPEANTTRGQIGGRERWSGLSGFGVYNVTVNV
ncbi:hypothetical protein Tco_0212892 [Tanacetum coccineum]